MKNTILSAILILLVITVVLFLLRPQFEQTIELKDDRLSLQTKQISLYHYFSGPLSDGMEEMIAIDLYTKPVVEAAVTNDNKIDLFPITKHFIVFFYNKQLFDREDLSAPNSLVALLGLQLRPGNSFGCCRERYRQF